MKDEIEKTLKILLALYQLDLSLSFQEDTQRRVIKPVLFPQQLLRYALEIIRTCLEHRYTSAPEPPPIFLSGFLNFPTRSGRSLKEEWDELKQYPPQENQSENQKDYFFDPTVSTYTLVKQFQDAHTHDDKYTWIAFTKDMERLFSLQEKPLGDLYFCWTVITESRYPLGRLVEYDFLPYLKKMTDTDAKIKTFQECIDAAIKIVKFLVLYQRLYQNISSPATGPLQLYAITSLNVASVANIFPGLDVDTLLALPCYEIKLASKTTLNLDVPPHDLETLITELSSQKSYEAWLESNPCIFTSLSESLPDILRAIDTLLDHACPPSSAEPFCVKDLAAALFFLKLNLCALKEYFVKIDRLTSPSSPMPESPAKTSASPTFSSPFSSPSKLGTPQSSSACSLYVPREEEGEKKRRPRFSLTLPPFSPFLPSTITSTPPTSSHTPQL